MKVLLINGSPKAKGCTYTALTEIAKELEKENIEAEIFHVGNVWLVEDVLKLMVCVCLMMIQ